MARIDSKLDPRSEDFKASAAAMAIRAPGRRAATACPDWQN